ncbi:MAG: toll/interleukin-1 receptor domain-containing protein [Proteobacteria bacterium]|nr:toll/interleukin-1 receptor domain-containing protein [Pseudomonadota bacterium]MBU4297664.1 toll/interleukin-1 receptor domain-containing protein [Pseudomonadota bacterium]MCG2748377.1 toll/interleukin-1 receptor domain-containing protein [Desulfobulbaceae bacterium]
MSFDLFVSYRHLDADRVRPVVEAMRGQGLSVWFDESVIEDFAPITDAIRSGLAQSKALLAWYSVTYPQSRPCQMELTAAYIAAGQANETARRVLVVNPEADSKHILPEPLRDNLYLPGDMAPVELSRRIASHLSTLTGCLGAIPPITAPSQYGARFTGSSRFVGRLIELWDLHGRLHQGEHAIISGRVSRPGLAQVAGMGGQGKSLLAEEYALRFGAAYPGGIFWLRALGQDISGSGPGLEQDHVMRDSAFRDIAQRLAISVQGKTLA